MKIINQTPIALALSITALIFLSACINQEAFVNNQRLCLQFTLPSVPDIPDCDTMEACTHAVEKRFYTFSQNYFPPAVQTQLFELKNQIAASWLNYHRFREHLHTLESTCLQSTDYAKFSYELNQTVFFLEQSFDESQQAIQSTFALIPLLSADLDNQVIYRVPEEPVFQNYLYWQENLNQLTNQNLTENSSTYYHQAVQALQELDDITHEKGFQTFTLKEHTPLDLAGYLGHRVLDKFQKSKKLFVPTLADFSNRVLTYYYNSATLSEYTDSLQRIPAFPLLLSYSNLISASDHSILSQFFSRVHSTAEQLSELEKTSQTLSQETRTELHQIESKLTALQQNPFASDTNFLVRFRIKFQSLKDANLFQALANPSPQSIGVRVHILKNTLNELNTLDEELNAFFAAAVLEKINTCAQQAHSAQKIKLTSPNSLPALLSLESKVHLHAGAYLQAQTSYEQYTHCQLLTPALAQLENLIQENQNTQRQLTLLFDDCTSQVQDALSSDFIVDQKSQFQTQWHNLPSHSTNGPSSDLLEQCTSLNNRVQSAYENASDIQQTFTRVQSLLNLITKLDQTRTYVPNALSSDQYEQLERIRIQLNYLKSSRNSPTISWKELSSLRSQFNTWESQLSNWLDLALRQYILQSTEISFTDQQPIIARVRIFNPLGLISRPLSFDLNFNSKPIRVHTPSFLQSHISNTTTPFQIHFTAHNLPSGLIDFNIEFSSPWKQTEQEEVLSLTPEKITLMKTLSIETSHAVSNISLETALDTHGLTLSDLQIIHGQTSIPFSRTNNRVHFTSSLTPPSEKFFIYSTLQNPLEVKWQLLTIQPQSELSSLYHYEVRVRNVSTRVLENFNLNLAPAADLPLHPLSIDKLRPYEERTYSLAFESNSLPEHYQNLIADVNSRLTLLSQKSNFPSPEFTAAAQKLQLLSYFPPTLDRLNELISLDNKIQTLSNDLTEQQSQRTLIEKRLNLLTSRLNEWKSLALKLFPLETHPFSMAQSYLQSAQEFLTQGELKRAVQALNETERLLSWSSFLPSMEHQWKQNAELLENLQSRARVLTSLEFSSPELSFALTELSNNLQQQSSRIQQADVPGFYDLNQTFHVQHANLQPLLSSLTETGIRTIAGELSELESYLSLDIVHELERELSSVNPELLISARYLTPTSQTRLTEYENAVNEFRESELFNKIQTLKSDLTQNSEQALTVYLKIRDSFQEKLVQFRKLHSTIALAQSQLKSDAENLYAKTGTLPLTDEMTSALLKAKNYLERGAYLKSIAVTGLLLTQTSPSSPTAFSWLYVLPVVLAMIFLIVWKWKTSNSAQKSKLKKKVPSLYDVH